MTKAALIDGGRFDHRNQDRSIGGSRQEAVIEQNLLARQFR